ncbi:DUF1194 domain-containing protein [Tranquillimonas alkanivorans]|uniref:VWFA domain-containing protein n=1 Tax=Tranquillimonas alkanivorans TaxID=441119 RepID=A0A1I5KFI6_9RHOB|nr:DUF1194 domain-containing protein [Tranquillimonas alkanivorans]SFO83800.1 Protein of unknown function [Tranquillimonas alkanivorans]
MGQHGKHRALVSLASALALVPAGAEAGCRLALLLALDVSSSVDADEDALQRSGLARALVAPEVRDAVFAVPGEPVALAVYEWSGRYQQDVLLDWTLLRAPADLEAASQAIAGSRRGHAEFPTALGYAVGYSARLFARAPECLFRTLDVSGDGVNNDGFPPRLAYENFPLEGVTVNGLPIGGHDPEVFAFYGTEVLRGPGAFLEVAENFEDYERAMRRKLVREIGARVVGAAPADGG